MKPLSRTLAPLVAALAALVGGCGDTTTDWHGYDSDEPPQSDSLWSLRRILDTLSLAKPGSIKIAIDSGGGASHGLVHEKGAVATVWSDDRVAISTYGREPFEFHLWFPFSEPREYITPHARADRSDEPVGAAMDYDEDGVWEQHVEGLGAILRITALDTANDLLSGRFVVRMGWPKYGTRFERYTAYVVVSGSFTDLPYRHTPLMEVTVVDSIGGRTWACSASDVPRVSVRGSRVTMENFIHSPGSFNFRLTHQWRNGVDHGVRELECDSTTLSLWEDPSFGPLRAVAGDSQNIFIIDEIDRVRRTIGGRFSYRMVGPKGEIYLIRDGVFRHVNY